MQNLVAAWPRELGCDTLQLSPPGTLDMELLQMMGLERRFEQLVYRFGKAATTPLLLVTGDPSDSRWGCIADIAKEAGRPYTRIPTDRADVPGLERLTLAIRRGQLTNHVLIFDRMDELPADMVWPFRQFWNQLDLRSRGISLAATAVSHPGVAEFDEVWAADALRQESPRGILASLEEAKRRISGVVPLPTHGPAPSGIEPVSSAQELEREPMLPRTAERAPIPTQQTGTSRASEASSRDAEASESPVPRASRWEPLDLRAVAARAAALPVPGLEDVALIPPVPSECLGGKDLEEGDELLSSALDSMAAAEAS